MKKINKIIQQNMIIHMLAISSATSILLTKTSNWIGYVIIIIGIVIYEYLTNKRL